MRRFSKLITVALFIMMAVTACGMFEKYDDSEIRERLDKLEGSTINTISQQISAMDKSINDLKTVDIEINQAIKDLGITDDKYASILDSLKAVGVSLANADRDMLDSIIEINSNIEYLSESMMDMLIALFKLDTDFDKKIISLQQYTDSCRTADMEWVSCTYSTLEMQDSILRVMAGFEVALSYMEENMKDSLSALNTSLSGAIEQSMISVMQWVNESLTGYYDIATADAKLAALEKRVTAVDSTSTANIATLQSDLLQAKTDLQDAYEKAISDAIETNNGIINKKIADEIEAVNTRIDTEINRIDKAIAELEGRISALETTVAELTKVLGITFSEKNISCTSGDIVKIDYTITNSNGHATVYTLSENGYVTSVETKTATTGIITVNVPSPLVNGNVLVFVNEDNKSCITALNFIEGSMTVSTDVVEVGADGGEVSVDVDTDLGYTVKVQDGITWLHDATVTTRSAIRYEKVTLIADATQLAFPRNAVVYLLNAAGDILSQYTVRQAGTVSSHEYVDLGLSVKWATCNVGATRPEEYGDYFAWGAIEPWYLPGYAQTADKNYGWKTGKEGGYCEANIPYTLWDEKTASYLYLKYFGNIPIEKTHATATDEDLMKTVLDPEDDAAYMNWGCSWRMPTAAEYDELFDNCTWIWYGEGNAVFGGVAGYNVTSNKTGYTDKSIFLPASGSRDDGYLNFAGSCGNYWSSSLSTYSSSYAYVLGFDSYNYSRGNGNRYCGLSVRPVCPFETTNVSLNRQSVEMMQSGTETLTATVQYENGRTDNNAIWLSSDTSIATVDQTGKITAVAVGTCTITASSGSLTATCSVTVIPFEPEYVDLGLSVKWATFNVGATKPEDYGSYFAWGETVGDPYIEGKTSGYSKSFDWSTYKYCNGSSTTMTKYCTWSNYGTVDNRTTLELSDDAARANWGGRWRMPTEEEIDELLDNCTWTWTTQNGVNGYKVTGKKAGYTDKSIFLPAAWCRNGGDLSSAGSGGYYWSSSLDTYDGGSASVLGFDSSSRNRYDGNRYCGRSVRPVCPVSVTGVELNTTSLSLEVGGTTTLTATVSPSNATDKSVQWSSSNTTVATVDSYGKVTAKSVGTATITVTTTDGNKTATCTVTVTFKQENGHDYVDLGLPSGIKWATCNIGASKPEEYGSYFAWGETTTKSSYTGSSLTYCLDNNGNKFSKYVYSRSYGTVDNKTTLELSDDAAHVNWGGKWRMPTYAEFGELISNCTWEWTTQNGVNGYKVTGKKAGYTNKSIFLPAAGCRASDDLYEAGLVGDYWSSSLDMGNSSDAYVFYFNSSDHSRFRYHRYYGQSVRPVCPSDNYVSVTGVELNTTSLSLEVGVTTMLTATVSPSYATDKSVTWKSSNTTVATVDSDGKITAKSDGTATITVTTTDGSNTATCTVTVKSQSADGSENGHDYVDLGLPSGLKWATCNVGATKPEDYGDYFAWGETVGDPYIEGKTSGYSKSFDWSTYKYCNGSSTTMTKYCTSSSYGTVDNKTTLELSDDAAHVNWGGKWRMPTATEVDELLNNCTWTWITQNGVNGYKVTSNNAGYTDKFIFLPAAGCRFKNYLYNAGYGYYRSSSLDTSLSCYDYVLYLYSDSHDRRNDGRNYGESVRPVCP